MRQRIPGLSVPGLSMPGLSWLAHGSQIELGGYRRAEHMAWEAELLLIQKMVLIPNLPLNLLPTYSVLT